MTQLARWRAGLAPGAGTDATAATAREAAWIRWVDITQSGWQLNASPLSVADVFGKRVAESGRAWIFTSATLAVGKDFSLYQRELGLADAATGCWESPFDYESQALLYVPRDLPQPNSREHTEAVVAAALPVLRASGGRAFLLFTTHRALNIARDLLAAAIAGEGLEWPLLVQGEGSRSELLTRFRELGNAILLGARASGRAWTCRARRCPSSSSTSCRSPRPTIRCSRRGSTSCAPKAATRSSIISCRRRSLR